jgi:predicted GTPase
VAVALLQAEVDVEEKVSVAVVVVVLLDEPVEVDRVVGADDDALGDMGELAGVLV